MPVTIVMAEVEYRSMLVVVCHRDAIAVGYRVKSELVVGGMPLAMLSRMTIQNSTNAPGAQIVPSVTHVLVLAP